MVKSSVTSIWLRSAEPTAVMSLHFMFSALRSPVMISFSQSKFFPLAEPVILTFSFISRLVNWRGPTTSRDSAFMLRSVVGPKILISFCFMSERLVSPM